MKYPIVDKFAHIYESFYKALVKSEVTSNPEKDLLVLHFLSSFAWAMHPGRFVDIKLDSWLLSIGQKIWNTGKKNSILLSAERDSSKRRVLHVATETYDTGGHSRFILNIIKNDGESIHSLALTNQGICDIPKWLKQAVVNSGGEVIILNDESTLVRKVAKLQYIICNKVDNIFYHIHPNDAVAVAALAAAPRPAVFTINHADHVFWLGSTLSDVVVCYRALSLSTLAEKRNTKSGMLLPIPLAFPEVRDGAKELAREKLSIPNKSIVILTVASPGKFIPSGQYNYYRTIKRVLDKNPNVLVKIIGIDKAEEIEKYGFEINSQIELLGLITQPQLYYEAADIYIDSMPISSYTSLLEAMYFKCFPVLPFNPLESMNVENEPALKGVVIHAKDESEQVDFIQQAIDNLPFRKLISDKGAKLVREHYTNSGWKLYLEKLYKNSVGQVNVVKQADAKIIRPTILSQTDIDSANISYSIYNNDYLHLLNWLIQSFDFLGILDFINIHFYVNSKKGKFGQLLSLKQSLWFIKEKLKKY